MEIESKQDLERKVEAFPWSKRSRGKNAKNKNTHAFLSVSLLIFISNSIINNHRALYQEASRII